MEQERQNLWPEYPFRDRADWSLGNWLGISGLSKTANDKFFKLPWLHDMAQCNSLNPHQPSFNSADELNQHIDNLPGGPE